MLELSAEAGLPNARIVSGGDLSAWYFQARTDNLFTSNGEQILLATVDWFMLPGELLPYDRHR
jgi:hypothetical protein